jgi:hypothetical protein
MKEQLTQFNYDPELIAYGTAYLAGLGLTYLADRHAKKEVGAALSAYSKVKRSEVEKPQISKLRKTGNGIGVGVEWITRKPAVLLGATAMVATSFLIPIGSETSLPTDIVIAADHSGATGISEIGNISVYAEINNLAYDFSPNNSVSSEAYTTYGNKVNLPAVPVAQIAKVTSANGAGTMGGAALFADKPDGTNGAVTEALNSAANNRDNSKFSSSAVVVETYGNYIGEPTTVIKQSRELGNIPIYVVNMESTAAAVESNSSGYKQNVKEFQQIAAKTGGQYFPINKQSDINGIANKIESKLSPNHQDTKSYPLRGYLGSLGAILALMTFKEFRERRRGRIQRNLGGK